MGASALKWQTRPRDTKVGFQNIYFVLLLNNFHNLTLLILSLFYDLQSIHNGKTNICTVQFLY